MSLGPDDKPPGLPRTGASRVAVGAVAALVLTGVVVSFVVRAKPGADEVTAVAACEAERTRTDSYARGSAVAGGAAYTSAEFAEYQEALVDLGFGADAGNPDVTALQAEAEAEHADRRARGGETVWVVWELEAGYAAVCEVVLQDGVIVGSAQLTGPPTY